MATAKDCHVLINYYLKSYEGLHGKKPVVNRNIARWGFDNMLYDLTMVEVKELIDFYMKTSGSHNHSLQWFYNNYEKLVTSKQEQDEDRVHREKLMAQTRARTEEWRKNGNGRGRTD